MNGWLEVLNGGIGNGIQDAGRVGYRHMGLAVSGSLDPYLARCANALVGNGDDAACIEMRALGPSLKAVEGSVVLAVAGTMTPSVLRADGRREEPAPWSCVLLADGDVFEAGRVRGGIAYLAVAGGIDTEPQLGSRSTYQRAAIGGLDGRLLAAGDRLPCVAGGATAIWLRQGPPWNYADGPIRVIAGPQDDHFAAGALDALLATEYRVSPRTDRMGMSLEGQAIAHASREAADIVSDGVTPGAIQVPGDGRPIILLADCQTVGGYPKIATVIAADLPRLAQLMPGAALHFACVSLEEARVALVERENAWYEWAAQLPTDPAPDEGDAADFWISIMC